MEVRLEAGPNEMKRMTSEELRNSFLAEGIIAEDQINWVYSMYDRMILGGSKPINQALSIETFDALKSDYFLERREIGIINTGADGLITVDGEEFKVLNLGCLYVGKGAKDISLSSVDPENPAVFFMISTPAHVSYPTVLYSKEDALPSLMGSQENVNLRTIYKYIHRDGIRSCQLVMGLTVLSSGNVWNTMPAHTHLRRSEVYFYFNLSANDIVLHLMGTPDETRHMAVKNHNAVISPPWSIHSGAGTSSYSFIWSMGGENQDFADMDFIPIQNLK